MSTFSKFIDNKILYEKVLMTENKINTQKKIVKILKELDDGSIRIEEAATKISNIIDEIVEYVKKERK